MEQAFFDGVNVCGYSNHNLVGDLSYHFPSDCVSNGDHGDINVFIQTETQTIFVGSNLLVQKCNSFP